VPARMAQIGAGLIKNREGTIVVIRVDQGTSGFHLRRKVQTSTTDKEKEEPGAGRAPGARVNTEATGPPPIKAGRIVVQKEPTIKAKAVVTFGGKSLSRKRWDEKALILDRC